MRWRRRLRLMAGTSSPDRAPPGPKPITTACASSKKCSGSAPGRSMPRTSSTARWKLVEKGVSVVVFAGEDETRPLTDRVIAFAKGYTDKLTVLDTRDLATTAFRRT